jgi:hypothetical protein
MGTFNDAYKNGQWEMFELITSVYFGKQYYSLQKDELVYSRYSHQYMNFQDALSEFCSCISDY